MKDSNAYKLLLLNLLLLKHFCFENILLREQTINNCQKRLI